MNKNFNQNNDDNTNMFNILESSDLTDIKTIQNLMSAAIMFSSHCKSKGMEDKEIIGIGQIIMEAAYSMTYPSKETIDKQNSHKI